MFHRQGRPSSISIESVASLSVYVSLVDFFSQPLKLCATFAMLKDQCFEIANRIACPDRRLLHEPGQTRKTSWNIHKCCMKNLTLNMSQRVTTGWPNARDMLRPSYDMLRWKVAIKTRRHCLIVELNAQQANLSFSVWNILVKVVYRRITENRPLNPL